MSDEEKDDLADRLGTEIMDLIIETFEQVNVPRAERNDLLVHTLYRMLACGDSVMPGASFRKRFLNKLVLEASRQ